jgi:hypothetical protein
MAQALLSVFALAGLVLLYCFFRWLFQSNNIPKKELIPVEKKIFSEEATLIQNLLNFPPNRVRVTISIENVAYTLCTFIFSKYPLTV